MQTEKSQPKGWDFSACIEDQWLTIFLIYFWKYCSFYNNVFISFFHNQHCMTPTPKVICSFTVRNYACKQLTSLQRLLWEISAMGKIEFPSTRKIEQTLTGEKRITFLITVFCCFISNFRFWGRYLPGPDVIKLFSCSTHLSMKFFLLINVESLK